MSLTSALELEIAEYYPQLRVFRSLCVLTGILRQMPNRPVT